MDLMAASEAAGSYGQDDTSSEVANTATDSQGHSESENKFQKAIAIWRGELSHPPSGLAASNHILIGVGLTELVPKLDATASEIVAHQRDSLVQRKDLAQKTKDFRKLDDEAKLGEYKGLLKGELSLA